VLCAVTVSPADLRSLSLYYYAVCGRMCMLSVRVWCSCLLVVCRSFVLRSYELYFTPFFKHVRKIAKSCLSIHLSLWKNSAPTGWIFSNFDI
jgi:hypothetical protein